MIDTAQLEKRIKNYCLSRVDEPRFAVKLDLPLKKAWDISLQRGKDIFPDCKTTDEAFRFLVIMLNRD